MSFPRYPAYKDSGVEWLGEVPAHWDVAPIKHLGRLQGGAGFPHDRQGIEGEELPFHKVNALAQANSDGFLIQSENTISRGTAKELGAFVFSPGTIVFAKVGAALLLGRIRLLNHNACLDNNMMGLVVRQNYYQVEFVRHGMSLVRFDLIANPGAVPSINEAQIGNFPLPIPPLHEQTKIATFLDRETAKIDELVAEQRRLMELLKEKRQAVISHAVTKGLNPEAPMKPSGIEWLGEVPAHWRVMSLGRVTVSRCDGPFGSGLKSEHYTDAGVRVIRLQNIRRDGFNGIDEAFIDADYFKSNLSGREVVSGDVLIAGLGDDKNTVGRACVAPVGIEPAMVKADCFRFRLDNTQAFPEFISTQLSASSEADAGVMSSGSTRSRIPLSVMATRKLAIPPIAEQIEIADFIRAEVLNFDTLTAEAQRAIDLLQERRTALISAAVTGQIDVRALSQTKAMEAAT